MVDPSPSPRASTATIAVPVVDGSADAPTGVVAAAIDRACRDVGFFAVVDHGVPSDLLARAFALAGELFDLPAEVKRSLAVDCPPGVQRGYAGIGAEAQAAAVGFDTPPDRSESFAIGPDPTRALGPFSAPNVWPPIDGFEATWSQVRDELGAVARRLLRACASALAGRGDAFDHLVSAPIGATRANHYPAIGPGEPIVSRQWRAGAHTDYGTLTVLAVDGRPGLEIELGGSWYSVTVPPGAMVVNVGDLLAAMSGGRWRSTWHRVAMPVGEPPHPARTSIAHFQFPNHDAPLGGDRGPLGDALPATAGEYLRRQIERSSLAAGPADTVARHDRPA